MGRCDIGERLLPTLYACCLVLSLFVLSLDFSLEMVQDFGFLLLDFFAKRAFNWASICKTNGPLDIFKNGSKYDGPHFPFPFCFFLHFFFQLFNFFYLDGLYLKMNSYHIRLKILGHIKCSFKML